MADLININQSRVKLWRRCRQAHFYQYVENIVPRQKKVQLERGTMFHAMLQAHGTGGSWEEVLANYKQEFLKLFAEERAMLGDLPKQLKRMMKGYLKAWKNEPLEYLAVEIEIGPLPLTNHTAFKGKIDGIAKDPQGRVWLVEHKTHKKFPTEDVRLQDMQTLIYVWALRQKGWKIDGILWDYIRTKEPTVPEILKSGEVSRRKIDTTPQVYLEVIKKAGKDPEDYRDILDQLESEYIERNYRRVYVPVQENLIPTIVADYAQSSLEIYHLQELPVHTFTRDCTWCSYYSLCQAEMRDLDTDFLKKADYVPREDHYDALSDTKENDEFEED